jgi:hypothetical protein
MTFASAQTTIFHLIKKALKHSIYSDYSRLDTYTESNMTDPTRDLSLSAQSAVCIHPSAYRLTSNKHDEIKQK